MKIERRQLTELRFDADDNEVKLRGVAVPYENQIDYGGWFREEFSKRAFKDGIGESVVLLANHQGLPYARTGAETLEFKEKADGLHYGAMIDTRDPDAMGLYVKIDRRDLTGVSVGFVAKEVRWIWGDGEEELDRRIIVRAELHEISVTPMPAYVDTNVEIDDRSLAIVKECRSLRVDNVKAERGNNRRWRDIPMPLDYELI